MRRRARLLLQHPVVRTLLFERFMITGSATLALAAVAMGRVRPSEIPGLLDARILTLFFVLTVAVREGGRPGFFWRPFCAVSGVILALLILFATVLLTLER